MPDFKSKITAFAADFEGVLDACLPAPTGHHAVIAEAMRYAALGGGKRLRPFLVCEAAKLFGVDPRQAMMIGASLECLHVYSLVHDDLPCMDDDDLRRGKPTVHKAYDEAIAVLAGDGLLTQAFEIITQSGAPAAVQVQLVADLAKAGGSNGMIGGQVVDITASETDRSEALITDLQGMKTGALIEYAVRAGGLLGGASDEQLTALAGYAQNLGLAFQIQDDVLDVEGDAETVGKAVNKDADLGKATFVSILGLEAAKSRAQAHCTAAKNHLAPFGNAAHTLDQTADFVLSRSH